MVRPTLRAVYVALGLAAASRQVSVALTSDKLFLKFFLVEFWQRFRVPVFGWCLGFPFRFQFSRLLFPSEVVVERKSGS